VKLKLKGCQFDTIEEIHIESQRVFDTLTEKGFREAFQKWRWWDWSLHAGGNCFEGGGGHRSYGEFYGFYNISPVYFGYHYVNAI
jgi:hypothetical protein